MAKKVKSYSELSNEDIALKGIEYYNKKDAIKELEKQCKECRVPLETYIETSGKKLPNGSLLAVISHADVDVYLKKTLRSSTVLTPEAIDILRENDFDECIEMVPMVREDIVERLHSEGKISDELLSSLFVEKSNFAFSVDLKSKMPDAPE